MMRFVAVVALFGAAATLTPAPASAADQPPTPPPAERRVTSNRDTLSGRGESGISADSIIAATDRPAASPTPAAGASQCHWAVAWRPQGSVLETTDALGLRTLSGDLPADASYAAAFRLQVDDAGYDLIQTGAADSQGLRYVVPYGSPECAAATGGFVTTAQVQDLAQRAFDEVKRRWPAQTIVLGWPQPTEDTWTALSTGMAWQPITATAASGGLTVTVTATPRGTEWDIGSVNARVGGTRTVRCDGPGNLPSRQDDASCRVWFAGPSTGLIDRHGQRDAVSLGLTVEWGVSYTSNVAGFADPAWLTWPTQSFLDGVVVNTIQAVPTASG